MAWNERGLGVLMKHGMASLWIMGFGLVLEGCSPSVGPSHPWVGWDQIDGQFRPELVAPPLTPETKSGLRIATFNVHFAADVDGIARALKGNPELARADVFFLQEIQSFPEEAGSRASRLASLLEMGYAYAPARTFGNGTHGVAILSRFPLENVAVMELPLGDLKLDPERRVALAADVRASGEVLHLVNLHLDTRLNATERILQLRPAVIDRGTPLVVGGDFNMNPMIWALNLLPLLSLSALQQADQAPVIDDYMRSLNFLAPTSKLGSTVDFPLLQPRLDAIYTRGLVDGSGAVERGVGVSDHWPVWQDVAIPGQ